MCGALWQAKCHVCEAAAISPALTTYIDLWLQPRAQKSVHRESSLKSCEHYHDVHCTSHVQALVLPVLGRLKARADLGISMAAQKISPRRSRVATSSLGCKRGRFKAPLTGSSVQSRNSVALRPCYPRVPPRREIASAFANASEKLGRGYGRIKDECTVLATTQNIRTIYYRAALER